MTMNPTQVMKLLPSEGEREQQLLDWITNTLALSVVKFALLSGDASFRRYFRLHTGQQSFIAMDAPPEKENCEIFSNVAQVLHARGVRVPEVYASDFDKGFLLLTDFGDDLLLDGLTAQTAVHYYQHAMDAILQIQTCPQQQGYTFPVFDQALYLQELNLFRIWFLDKKQNLILSAAENKILDDTFNLLITTALQQPQYCVHRDFHSRNLMRLADHQLAVLDFQDAVWGPVTYDIVSLLRDCYIDWPVAQVTEWLQVFYEKWLATKPQHSISFAQFQRDFDWLGLQRHLKCIGIFSRLALRDGKTRYLEFIPRIRRYVINVCERYAELQPFLAYFIKWMREE